MTKRVSQTADVLSPWLDSVQSVSVQSIETRVTHEWPDSLGINVEATALSAATYRGDQIVVEKVAKFSSGGFLAARFLSGGDISIDSAPDATNWTDRIGLMVRGSGHESIALTDGSSTKFIRGGNRLIEVGYDTYAREFPAAVTLPGGSIFAESGALGIGVGIPGAWLHVSGTQDQLRIEHPDGGALSIEVDSLGDAHIAPASGRTTIYGQVTTKTLNATAVNVNHLHNATQVLDKTLALSGAMVLAERSVYLMQSVASYGGAAVSITVAEKIDETGAQVFVDGSTVSVFWVSRTGTDAEHEVIGTVVFVSRDASVYPAQQTYTFTPSAYDGGAMPAGNLFLPNRSIVYQSKAGKFSMLNTSARIELPSIVLGNLSSQETFGPGLSYDGSSGAFLNAGASRIGVSGSRTVIGISEDPTNLIPTSGFLGSISYYSPSEPSLRVFIGRQGYPSISGAWDSGEGTSILSINATSLAVNGTAVTLSSVVPNTAPAAGQILVGNAGGTAYAPVSMSGDATLASTGALTIAASAVTLAKMADMATASLLGRNTAGTGAPEVLSVATTRSLLSINNVENTALSTWAGSANITTVGTLTALSVSGNSTLTGQAAIGTSPLSGAQLYLYRGVTDPAATQYGQRTLLSKNSTTADSSLLMGLSLAVITGGAGTHSGTTYGAYFQAYHNAATSGGSQVGLRAESGVAVASGTSALAISIEAGATGSTSATVTTRYGLNIAALDTTTLNTSLYALAIQGQTDARGTTKIGLYIGNISGASGGNYAIYTGTGIVSFGDSVGIGTYPSGRLHVAGTTVSYFDRAANPSNIIMRRVNGSIASPTQVLSGETVMSLTAMGYGVAGFPSATGARIQAIALENQTTTAYGMYLSLGTVAAGGTTYAERLRIDSAGLTLPDAHDFVFGTATGTKHGTAASQKQSWWGVTPVVQPASANQAAVSATAATQTTPWGFASQAQADGIVTLLNEIRSALVSIGAIKGAA